MSKTNQIIKVMILLIVLFIISISPIWITKLNNERLFNKYNVKKISKESLKIEHESIFDYNTLERIQTIVKAQTEKTGVITRQEIDIKNERISNLIDIMKEQILTVQKMNGLPEFDIDEDYTTIYLYKATFMDSVNPNTSTSVWEINISYPEFGISVTMDTETSVIYQISIYSREDKLQFDTSKISPIAFLEYLEIDSKEVAFKQNEDNTKGFYYVNINNLNVKYTFIKRPNYFMISFY